MNTWTNEALTHHKSQRIGFDVAMLLASMGAVAAQERRPSGSDQYYNPYPNPPCTSLADCDRKAFDESGARGRMGLGADPAHPEGPGNVSD
jgi:hypothetical protein